MVKYIELTPDPKTFVPYGRQTDKRLEALEKGRGVDRTQVRAIRNGGGGGGGVFATPEETQDGELSNKAVTPAGLSSRTATEERTGLMMISDVWEILNGKATVEKNNLNAITPQLLQVGLEDHIAARHGMAVSLDYDGGTNDLNSKNATGFFFSGEGAPANLPSDVVSSSNLFMTIQSAVGEVGDNQGWGLGTLQLLYEVDPATFTVLRSWQRFWNGSIGEFAEGDWERTDPSWDVIDGKPSTYPPSAHTHTASQITDFATAVDARVNSLVPNASTTARGKVELATNTETVAGTDTARAVTPAGLKAALDALPPGDTQHPGAGDLSIQLGENADALGDFSISVGHNSSTTGTGGVSLGPGATSSGYGSSFGASAEAGDAGSAFGSASQATGAGSAAIGLGTQATHAGSTAVGVGATTTKDHQIVLGTASEEVFFPGTTAYKGDTDWVNITSFESGFTTGGTPGQLQYKIKNGVCYWRGGVNGTFPSGSYTTFLTNFPLEARPVGNVAPLRFGGAANGANPAFVEIHADGHMVGAHAATTTRTWIAFNTSYPLT